MSLWMCRDCARLQGFSESMRCHVCSGVLQFATIQRPPAAALVERAKELEHARNSVVDSRVDSLHGSGDLRDLSRRCEVARCAVAVQAQAQEPLEALVVQWRAQAARINSFHATMGTGYTVCADELEAALRSLKGAAQ